MVWYPSPEDALTDDGSSLLAALEESQQPRKDATASPSSAPAQLKPPPVQVGGDLGAGVQLYIAGLGPKVDAAALRAALEVYGKVTEVKVVYDKATGRSKGFGFATVVGASAASAAIDDLTDSSTLGRRLVVRKAFR